MLGSLDFASVVAHSGLEQLTKNINAMARTALPYATSGPGSSGARARPLGPTQAASPISHCCERARDKLAARCSGLSDVPGFGVRAIVDAWSEAKQRYSGGSSVEMAGLDRSCV